MTWNGTKVEKKKKALLTQNGIKIEITGLGQIQFKTVLSD